jgi:hypothetical protein
MTGTEPHAWGTGLMDDITFVGLDVHKATVCIAVAEGGRGGEVRQLGVFENRPESRGRVPSGDHSLALQTDPQCRDRSGLNRSRRVAPRIANIGQHIRNLLVIEVPAEGRHRGGCRRSRSRARAAAD